MTEPTQIEAAKAETMARIIFEHLSDIDGDEADWLLYREDLISAAQAIIAALAAADRSRRGVEQRKWTGTRQRDDLKTCPFCNTKAVQQVRLADNETNTHYRIGCGNPHCFVEPNTPPFAALKDAEHAWENRA